MMEKYKGFYPSWYVEKKNNDFIKKFKKYLGLIGVMIFLLLPSVLKNSNNLNLNPQNKINFENINLIDELGFLLSNNIDNFIIENKSLRFKIPKNELKVKLETLEKKINIKSVEEVLEENMYLIEGEFYEK